MPLFETEDEWEENWFDNAVDKLENQVETDRINREKSGFTSKSDQEWAAEKKARKIEADEKQYYSDINIERKVNIVKKK